MFTLKSPPTTETQFAKIILKFVSNIVPEPGVTNKVP